jgi:hypothetical protein
VIGFARPAEPAALPPLRAAKLAAARTAKASGAKVDFTEYDVVKPALFAMQHGKCCYCEKREEQAKYRDVEHYRPKVLYWWLTWTWENLLFACIDCNREQKRDRFPLSPEGPRLVPEQAPPGEERPLVLDPSDRLMDPAREIEFRRERVSGRERWVPHGVTPRGSETIAVCGLDRPNLLDLYTYHVVHGVRPKLDAFFTAHREGDAQDAFKAWERTKRGLLLPGGAPFRALSHDALNMLVPVELRERYRLVLDRPTSLNPP